MKCFKKEHYPLPDQAAAAFEAASEQVLPDRSGMGLMQMAPVAGAALHTSLGSYACSPACLGAYAPAPLECDSMSISALSSLPGKACLFEYSEA